MCRRQPVRNKCGIGKCRNLLCISVGVQTTEEKVDAEIGEEDANEPDDGQPGHAVAVPPFNSTGMEESGIDKPGNQRPCLLGIPAPISAPRQICPDGSRDDPQRQPEKSEEYHLIVELVELPEIGKQGECITGSLLFQIPCDIENADAARNREGRIAEEAGHDMGNEPVALQGREKWLNLRAYTRGKRSICHCQEGEESGEHAQGPLLGPVFHDQINEHDCRCREYQ